MSGLSSDLKHGVHGLLRAPGLTATLVLTVGLGLGATAAMVTVIHAVLVKPLPYENPDSLVWIFWDRRGFQNPLSVADYRAIEAQQTAFSHLAAYQTDSVTVTGGAAPARVTARGVTWAYFSTLGRVAARGRLFDQADDQPGRHIVVLSHEFWTTECGADPSAIGRELPIDGVGHTVVGVAAADRSPLDRGVSIFRLVHWNPPPRRGPFFIRAIARLQPGVTPAAALDELRAINRRTFQDADASYAFLDLKRRAVGDVGSTLVFVLAAVGCVLLIACANAVNLLLARSMRRGRELTIRAALGASRRRILQYLATETALLTIGAAVLGLAIAAGALRLIHVFGGEYIPRIDEIRLGGPAIAWLGLLSLASAIVIGIVPAIHSARLAEHRQLRSGGRSVTDSPASRRVRRVLVGVEFAIATPLLIAAVLVLTTLERLRDVPVGVDSARVLTASIALPQSAYPDAAATGAFWRRALERLARLPGVDAAAFADGRPPDELEQRNDIDLEDQPTPPGNVQPMSPWVGVTPDAFRTVGLSLQEGRLLDDRDFLPGSPNVVVVDRAWAARFFPNQRVLGRRFRSGGCSTCAWTTVVGVVGTAKYLGLGAPDEGTVYWPLRDRDRNRYVLLRSAQPAALVEPLGRIFRELDPNLAVTGVATVDQLVNESLAQPRYLSVLVATFGATALVLSLVGIYGVMTFFVQQHRRDIGIRLALGGDPYQIGRRVVGQGLAIVAIGVAAGLGTTFLTTRIVSSALYGVSATDPVTLSMVPGFLVAAALAACLMPARRAAGVDPAEVLRES
ncbi:MAG TPA: ABC transporter permease [Vicinamibacterales bacterium]|nr:ABC transporter permease [Vicinamibacterales bacterium]